MIELLNLDALVEVKRTVTIRGVDYPLAEQTVDQMLDGIAKARKAQKGNTEMTPERVLTDMADTCLKVVPTAPREVICSLTLRQMIALIEFATKKDDELQQSAESAGEAEPGKTS